MSEQPPRLDRLAPSLLVLQLLSTVMFVSILVTVPADHVTPIEVWALYWCSLVCWLAFAVTLRSSPRFSTAALITCLGFAVFAFGPSPDGTPVLLACIALAVFTSLPSVAASTIIWVFAAAAIIGPGGALLYGQGFLSLLGDLAALVVVALVGLNRRQHQVQARQAELLLEQHKLFQQEQARTAALDERARIAREIHDVLAHSLGALGVQLEVAEALLEDKGDVDGALLRVRRSRRLAHEGLAEARRAVAALRSDVPSLSDALDELAEDFRRDRQATVDFRIDGQPRPVSSATTVSLLRTAREALTNAAKHAPGAAVSVVLDYRDEAVALRVHNNAPTEQAATDLNGVGGYGLTGMRERIALAGGTLSAGSDDGGWLVTAEVPE